MTQTQSNIAYNKKAILKALAKIKATSATVSYSGSGDNGCVDDVFIDAPEQSVPTSNISIKEKIGVINHKTGKWRQKTSTKDMLLTDAIEALCYDLLEKEHTGWEDNDGADGLFDFDVKTGKIKWQHNENYVKQETTIHEI